MQDFELPETLGVCVLTGPISRGYANYLHYNNLNQNKVVFYTLYFNRIVYSTFL